MRSWRISLACSLFVTIIFGKVDVFLEELRFFVFWARESMVLQTGGALTLNWSHMRISLVDHASSPSLHFTVTLFGGLLPSKIEKHYTHKCKKASNKAFNPHQFHRCGRSLLLCPSPCSQFLQLQSQREVQKPPAVFSSWPDHLHQLQTKDPLSERLENMNGLTYGVRSRWERRKWINAVHCEHWARGCPCPRLTLCSFWRLILIWNQTKRGEK